MRIALLEDDPDIASLVRLWLENEAYNVKHYTTGQGLIETLKRESFDLLVLDWLVPGVDGKSVLQWVRANLDWHIPVIFVTQRDAEEDVVAILSLGADDYITKPIRPKEMLARIGAIARRAYLVRNDVEPLMVHAPYLIDSTSRTVTVDGERIKLTQKEFELVVFLFKNIGRILSRSHILESVWGLSSDLNTRTADTHVSRIRNKLRLTPERGWQISAIYHHGYRLEQVDTAKFIEPTS